MCESDDLPSPSRGRQSKPDASATRSGDPSYQHIRDIWARHAQYMWGKKNYFLIHLPIDSCQFGNCVTVGPL